MKKSPRITAATMAGTLLSVAWDDGTANTVELAGWLALPVPPGFEILTDPEVLARPHVAHWGTLVAWDEADEVGIDHVHVRHLARQQRPFLAEDLSLWQSRLGLSNSEAARLLGIGVSTFAGFKAGSARIPAVVQIACKAMEADPLVFEAHYRPSAPAGRPRRQRAA